MSQAMQKPKVVLVMVASLNGKITRGKNPRVSDWASKEDQDLFKKEIAKAKAIVMGSGTYDAIKNFLKLQPGKLRTVLTRHPERYRKATVPGQLEFSNVTPKTLAQNLVKRGHKEILLVGGGVINGLFLKAKLVDEIRITIEPLLFESGAALVVSAPSETKLKLMSVQTLNKQGTLYARYKVLR